MSGRGTGRAKRLRRVIVLTTAVAAVGAAAVVVTRQKHARQENELQTLRRVGMDAYAVADYPAALKSLDRYVAEHGEDDDAGLADAVARSHVEAPGGTHLKLAIQRLNQVLAHPGDHPAARRAMIDLLVQTSDTARLAELADEALAVDPADATALRARVAVGLRQNRPDDALTAALAYARAVPDDVPSRLTAVQLMRRVNRPTAELTGYADTQFTPGDPRRALIRASADAANGDTDAAADGLRKAADPVPADPVLVVQIADAFDGLQRFDESTRLLEAAARQSGDARLTRSLALRLWQQGHGDRVLAGLPGFDATTKDADATVLAVTAMASYDAGRPADARAIVATLVARRDRVAMAWAAALPARYESSGPPAIDAFVRALSNDPANAVVRAWLAAAHADAGEPVLALRHWTAAAEGAPTWSRPQAGRAAALAALGCDADAVDAAQAAYDRAPGMAAAIDLIDTRFARYEKTPDPAAARDLLDATARVLAVRPNEARAIAVRVAVLCRLGCRDEAAALLSRVDASHVDDTGLLRLVDTGRRESLGGEDRLLAAAAGRTAPAVVLAHATSLADRGHAAEGRALLDGEPSSSFAWRIARARYAQATHASDAAAQWIRLADETPTSIDAQSAALDAVSAGVDRVFVTRAIDRLHGLTGDDAAQWRLYRARALLDGPDPATSAAEAVTVLTDLVRDAPRQTRPRLELARALRLAGNPASAVEHLKLALGADPLNVDVLVPLVTLLRAERRGDEAATLLRQFAARPTLPPQTAVAVATLCLNGGDPASAVALLSRPAAPASGAGLLSAAYARLVVSQRSAERWNDLRVTAGRWRASCPADALAADTAAAEADLAQRHPDTAAAILRPYEARLLADGRATPQATVVLARIRAAEGHGTAARDVLRPLLVDAAGRRAARALAGGQALTLTDATTGLSDADDATPAAAVAERSEAAAAWAAVGRKFGDAPTLEIALARAGACLVARPGDADTRLLRAGLLQQLGRSDSAEAALRSLLDVAPTHAAANNDLACLLLSRGGDPAEAARRAAAAVAAAPREAAFHDTLARARLAQHDPKAASASFQDALRLNPGLTAARTDLDRLTATDIRAGAAD